jgi:phospho-N-acetylmuramoyl-pentapeptide-transferase
MGDTEVWLGGIIAVLAIAVRKELLIPLLCGVFLVENLSVVYRLVILNILKNALANKEFPDGVASSHQKKGYHESKKIMILIVIHTWIIT